MAIHLTRLQRLVRLIRDTHIALDPLQPAERVPKSFETVWRSHFKRRVLVVVAFVGIWVLGIEARLFQLQVVQHDELSARAKRHQQTKIALEATRGDILDREGRLLAYSVEADSITADPSKVKDPAGTLAAICGALGDCTAGERRKLLAQLSDNTAQYMVIRSSRTVGPEQVKRVAALKLPGVVLQSDTRRYYPRIDLAAHVLGFVDIDNRGQAGVERAFDQQIRGRDGVAIVQVDAKRQRLDSRVAQAPVPGATLELTIDLYLQYILERELKAGVEENRARGGAAIIMDPHTGEILALASYPTFNPNAAGKFTDDDRRNRATQDVYEPGSTFKMVTASAALESGVVKPMDLIDTNPGYITLPGRRSPIRDTHPHGVIPFEDVIVVSSNVGAVKVGLRTGIERMTRYVHRFGFGEALAPDFRGQSRGLWNPNNLSESGIASVSIGYQVSVTPLQMVTAASAVANGGLLMEPRVVRALIHDGRRDEVRPKVLRRAIEPQTAATLTEIMEGVVSSRGTAPAASLDRYQVAGKTGTAAKLVDGRYSRSDYNASFVGFVPSRNPAFTILVVIDTPRGPHGYYGGTVAAPIFKRIAQAALLQTGVRPSVDPAPPVLLASTDAPALPEPAIRPSLVPTLTSVGGLTVMPDVTGLSARSATRVLSGLGLDVRVSGSGAVTAQTPEPGSPIDPGAIGSIHLERFADVRDDFKGVR
jgi:cell division protein FtsI (penicillin-binding protein 3)